VASYIPRWFRNVKWPFGLKRGLLPSEGGVSRDEFLKNFAHWMDTLVGRAE
jgi:hypothetical protein